MKGGLGGGSGVCLRYPVATTKDDMCSMVCFATHRSSRPKLIYRPTTVARCVFLFFCHDATVAVETSFLLIISRARLACWYCLPRVVVLEVS